jgi:hypothetical protein
MTGESWPSDEQLLAALKDALRAAESVPPEFVAAGKAISTCDAIEIELAALIADSALDTAAMRAESASLRALTYSSAAVTIELEVTPEVIFGQLLPPQTGSVTVYTRTGAVTELAADHLGFFAIRPIPAGSFRLRCRTDHCIDVLTGWIGS